MKRGFTLIELLVFLGIFSTIIVTFITILVTMLNIQANEAAATEVEEQGQFILQQIQYYVSGARLIDMTQDLSTSTLVVRPVSGSGNPTTIALQPAGSAATSGAMALQQGVNGAWQLLTSDKVSVSHVSFTRHYNLGGSSAAFGEESVSYTYTVSATSTNGGQYSQAFQSSVAVLNPVPKIAMIQQASAADNAPSVSSLGGAYATNNEAGDLLIAVVANTASGASVSVSDTAGNTWNKIASMPYAAYNEELNVFDAVNAVNSSNTVTASFGSGAGYASLYLYEYRGASTSSPLDASSSQLQPDTQTPSSGMANPTSSVELVFGATYNGSTGEIPSAGSGFTIETSSTVSHVFAEDATQYITGSIAATWQYSGTTPSSSALVVTFR